MPGDSIRYYPTKENRLFLLDLQSEKRKIGPIIGLDHFVDELVTEVREAREKAEDDRTG